MCRLKQEIRSDFLSEAISNVRARFSDCSVSRKVMIMMIRIIFRRDPVKTFHKIFFYTRKTFVYSDSCRCMLCNYIDNSFSTPLSSTTLRTSSVILIISNSLSAHIGTSFSIKSISSPSKKPLLHFLHIFFKCFFRETKTVQLSLLLTGRILGEPNQT